MSHANSPFESFTSKLIFIACLALSVIYIITFLYLPGAVAFDDAFITYRYAQNLLHGQGLCFNPGEFVEGYTNFLWVLINTLGLYFGYEPLIFSRIVGFLSVFISLLLLASSVFSLGRLTVARVSTLLLISALVLLELDYLAFVGSGLEVGAVGTLILAFGLSYHFFSPKRVVTRLVLGVIPCLVIMLRPDLGVAVGVSFLLTLIFHFRDRASLNYQILLPMTLIGVYMLWRYWYFGDIFPNTYYAKGGDEYHLKAGILYLSSFIASYPQTLIFFGFSLISLSTDHQSRESSLFFLFTYLAYVAVVVKVGGDFMEYRLLLQVYPVLLAAAMPGMLLALSTAPYRSIAIFLVCFGLFFSPVHLEKQYYMQEKQEMNRYHLLGKKVGVRLKETLPPNTKIATTLIGTIAYYSNLPIVDLWGLVDSEIAKMKPLRPFRRGHYKMAPRQYALNKGTNLYIEHPVICPCNQLCKEELPNVFIQISPNQCMRSWYMKQQASLTEHLCSAPPHTYLHNISCEK